jgi:hypothetical protein
MVYCIQKSLNDLTFISTNLSAFVIWHSNLLYFIWHHWSLSTNPIQFFLNWQKIVDLQCLFIFFFVKHFKLKNAKIKHDIYNFLLLVDLIGVNTRFNFIFAAVFNELKNMGMMLFLTSSRSSHSCKVIIWHIMFVIINESIEVTQFKTVVFNG